MTCKDRPTIGLMGGPGSGKSLVARQMAAMGCVVIDSDALAKEMLEEEDIKQQIALWWGGGVLRPDGQVDRSKVARIVFADPSELKRLEALIHPRVHARREVLKHQALVDPETKAIVEDCPLLLESGIDSQCDALVLVEASFQTRLKRVQKTRGWGAQELGLRDKSQTPLDIKQQRADYVISNDADEAHCLEQTRRVLSQIIP
jgi:dephospho-CoA kinase